MANVYLYLCLSFLMSVIYCFMPFMANVYLSCLVFVISCVCHLLLDAGVWQMCVREGESLEEAIARAGIAPSTREERGGE